ncbi:MAG: hypothetical protein PHF57_09700 [Methanoregula sp.]|jgi:hypothetical protein|nr:hypothetical protein [Methanoregula sp.]
MNKTLTKRIAEFERRNPSTSPAVDIAELKKAVYQVIERMDNDIETLPLVQGVST